MGQLASIIMKNLQQPPEVSYEFYFEQTLWSLREFASLMAGMTPIEHERLIQQVPNCSEVEMKKMNQAHAVLMKLMKFLKKDITTLDMHVVKNEIYMTKWQFIKWIALHDIPVKKRFFSALSLDLMELYKEFQPINAHLRTKNEFSREYHEALYLTHAQKLISICGPLTPIQIFRHPRMQGLFKSFQGPKRYYAKRTILESWLPKLGARPRGRPQKRPKTGIDPI